MRAGRFVGRVGGLAVALGVGVAVASSPGVAWADDIGSASSEGSTGAAGATGTGGTSDCQDTSTTVGTTAEPAGTSTAAGIETKGASAPGSNSVGASESGASASTGASVRRVPPGMVNATGGADSSTKSSSETSNGDVAAGLTTDESSPKPVAGSTSKDPEALAVVTTVPVGGPRGGSNNRQQLVDEPSGAPGRDANTLIATSGAPPSRPQTSRLAGTLVDVAVRQPAALPAVTAAAARTLPVLQTGVVARQAISAAPAVPTPPRPEVSGMVLGLLAAAGLGPPATNGPPVDSPLGLALLAVGARPRQFGQAGAEESRNLPVSPTLTSQMVPEVTSAALMTSAAPVTFTAQTGSSPAGVVASPDGTRVYVADTGSNTVSVFAATGELIDANPNVTGTQPISVGSSPSALAISADGKRLYVANTGSGTVSVIGTDPTNSTTYHKRIDANPSSSSMDIGVGSSPSALAISGTRLYVANRGSNTVSVIDTATNKVIDANPNIFSMNIGVGSSPSALAISGTRLYVANSGSNTVSVIDTTTNKVIDANPSIFSMNIGVGSSPSALAISGTRLYVANGGSNTVSVINTATNSCRTNTITVGSQEPSRWRSAPTAPGCMWPPAATWWR